MATETPTVTHTPGPWRTTVPQHPISELARHDRMILGRAFDGSEKAIVDRVRGGTPEEADANARLIAAAPDLLAALKRAREALKANEDISGTWELYQHSPEMKAIDAAIAKAEGD